MALEPYAMLLSKMPDTYRMVSGILIAPYSDLSSERNEPEEISTFPLTFWKSCRLRE